MQKLGFIPIILTMSFTINVPIYMVQRNTTLNYSTMHCSHGIASTHFLLSLLNKKRENVMNRQLHPDNCSLKL